MILLDTHVWIWWIEANPALPAKHREFLTGRAEREGLGVSAISCWEAAKLVRLGRLHLPSPTEEWLDAALGQLGFTLYALTPRVAVESSNLPGDFHRDPADQMIVATARVYHVPLLTLDAKILNYPHVPLAEIESH